jgi:lysophospholipase L1-like esterase
LGQRFVPGHQYWQHKENDIPISGKINNLGWRDKERSLTKPANTFRVAVLGDSFVEAFQVELDRTFPILSENELNRGTSKRVEIMNFGLSGYTQTEELLILQNELEKYAPDMVMLFFFPGNDIDDVKRATAYSKMRPFFKISENRKLILDTSFSKTLEFKAKCFINIFKNHSALISLLTERYNAFKLMIAERRRKVERGIPGYLSLCTDNPDSGYTENYKINKLLIKTASEHCKKNGMKFMLVVVDDVSYMPEYEKKYKDIDSSIYSFFFDDDLGQFAKLIGAEYIGLTRLFRKYCDEYGSALHWQRAGYTYGHWNYKGHEIVAETIVAKLKQIIPESG